MPRDNVVPNLTLDEVEGEVRLVEGLFGGTRQLEDSDLSDLATQAKIALRTIINLNEKQMIEMHFGLNGHDVHTVKKIAEILAAKDTIRVQQIIDRLIVQLRTSLRHNLKNYAASDAAPVPA